MQSAASLMLFILNHKPARQAGYALSPDAAKQLASGRPELLEAPRGFERSTDDMAFNPQRPYLRDAGPH